jgi:hypothetical protein
MFEIGCRSMMPTFVDERSSVGKTKVAGTRQTSSAQSGRGGSGD